jgi:hypothetical protein
VGTFIFTLGHGGKTGRGIVGSKEEEGRMTRIMCICGILTVIAVSCFIISIPASAQVTCSTTVECAQRAVDAAAQANAAVQALQARIDSLEAALRRVTDKATVWGATDSDVMYDPPANVDPFNGVPRNNPIANTTPPSPYVKCIAGYAAVGLYLTRSPSGLNDARLVCRKLSSGVN